MIDVDVAVVALIVIASGASFAFGFLAGVEQTRRAARDTMVRWLDDPDDPLARMIVGAILDKRHGGR